MFKNTKIAGYWFLDTGFWLLVSGYWLLVAGCWMLDAGLKKKFLGMNYR